MAVEGRPAGLRYGLSMPADDASRILERLEAIEATLKRVERGARPKTGRPRAKITDKRFLRTARQIVGEGRTLLREDRLWTLWQAVGNARRLGLPALEAGTYRGGSAAFLAAAWSVQADADLALDVVDTFAGHAPGDPGASDESIHDVGHFGDTSAAEVSAYLATYPGVRVHEGTLAEVSPRLERPQYGLIHLDMDLHQPTIDGLRFFHERIPRGGMVILDDYGARKCPGVRQAADEFLHDHPDYAAWDPLSEQLVLTRWN